MESSGGWPPADVVAARRPQRISHMPLSRTFYVAPTADSLSTTRGQLVTTPIDPANPKLFSVLVVNRTTGVAADSRRVWFLNNGQWNTVAWRTRRGRRLRVARICLSVVGGRQRLLSRGARQKTVGVHDRWRRVATDARTATSLTSLPRKRQSRAFCTCGPRLDGDPTHLDVYYGDGVDLWRQAVTTVVPGGTSVIGGSSTRSLRSADLAFTPGNTEPLMLATDGACI